jgi:hypothetical protein
VVVAVFNLLPLMHLDGATAWRIVPVVWLRWRAARRRASLERPERRPRRPTSDDEPRGTVHKGPWVH